VGWGRERFNPTLTTARCYVTESCVIALRYVVAVLGFVGFFCAYASRGCINVAIVVMVNSTDDDPNQPVNISDRCPPHGSLNHTVTPSPQVYCISTLVH